MKNKLFTVVKFAAGILAGIGADIVVSRMCGGFSREDDNLFQRAAMNIGVGAISGMVGSKVTDYIFGEFDDAQELLSRVTTSDNGGEDNE